MISLEFLIYSKTNYFLRLLITESLSCRSYSKIYLPYEMHSYNFNMDQLKKELETRFTFKKLNNESHPYRKVIKILLTELTHNILHKTNHLTQFDNFETIINKINPADTI
jgi:hypothetical protein